MKICTKCNVDKDMIEFTTSSGNVTANCRTCKSNIQRDWKKKNPEKIRAIKQKEYQKNKARCDKKSAEWTQKNPEARKAITLKYRQNNKDQAITNFHSYRRKHPDRVKAGAAIRNALYSKKITRPAHCARCQKECKPEGHHSDYSKPLEVIWLCKECHTQEHKDLQNGTTKENTTIID